MGFENVTRLEQYAFLLRVALNRLYALLKKRGVVPASPPPIAATTMSPSSMSSAAYEDAENKSTEDGANHDNYRDSQDIKRMKNVNLDRKLSTKAKVPHISTVVGSPSGRVTQSQKATSPYDQRLRRSPSPGKPSDRGDQARYEGAEGGSRTPLRQDSGDAAGRAYSQAYSQPSSSLSSDSALQYTGTQQGPIVPIRPAFARHNTDVRIQDQGPIRQPSGDEEAAQQRRGSVEEGLTLADIPQLLEAEQAREQHRMLPSNEGRSLSELSALELFIVKHMAVMMLQQSALKEFVPFDD